MGTVGSIPFSAGKNVLNPALKWESGGLPRNDYDLSQLGELVLTAGRGSDHWKNELTAPLVAYPVTGNFEAEVKVDFNPKPRCPGRRHRGAINSRSPHILAHYSNLRRRIGVAKVST